MRFRFFFRVPWWLALFVFAVELAALIVYLPFWAAWKLYDHRLALKDEAAIARHRMSP